MSAHHALAGVVLALAGCDASPGYEYCQDDDLVLASTVDEADWPDGWPEAWADILEFQGSWLVAAVSNDDSGLALGEVQLGISIEEDSLMLLPPESEMECQDQDADGEIEITWSDGSVDLLDAEFDIQLHDTPTERGGTRGSVHVSSADGRQEMGMTLFGDGGFESSFVWQDGTTAVLDASAEDHLSIAE